MHNNKPAESAPIVYAAGHYHELAGAWEQGKGHIPKSQLSELEVGQRTAATLRAELTKPPSARTPLVELAGNVALHLADGLESQARSLERSASGNDVYALVARQQASLRSELSDSLRAVYVQAGVNNTIVGIHQPPSGERMRMNQMQWSQDTVA